jgi:hypothetical protein
MVMEMRSYPGGDGIHVAGLYEREWIDAHDPVLGVVGDR